MDRCPKCGKYDKDLAQRGYCIFCEPEIVAEEGLDRSNSVHCSATVEQCIPGSERELDDDQGKLREPEQANRFPDSGPAPSPQPARVVGPGYRFNDRYLVERELGQGGMGKVYLARDEKLGRQIAVKVIRPQDPRLLNLTIHRKGFAQGFLEEAKVGAELDHPNIAKVFDYGIDHEEPYTVFEYIEGETLKEMLARRGRLPLEEAQHIVAALAQGLAYAHARHIVHRDLKPANIRITPEGVVKILDLGLAARFRDQADWSYCGTPSHIAPEQVASQPCDGRTDQYALAVIAYELLSGQLPFSNPNIGVLLQQHLRQPPPDPRLHIDLPEDVATAILRALAKKPDDRFTTCDEFAAALGCQVLRRGAEVPRFLRSAMLTATHGPHLSVRARWWGLTFNSTTLNACFLALATDGLYACYQQEVTRWALAEMGKVERKGLLLTVRSRDGKKLQSFTFAKKGICKEFDTDLQQMLANGTETQEPKQAPIRERRSVFLLQKRVWFPHQTLGNVSYQSATVKGAQAALQIQGYLLGADAVAEVATEQSPSFFNGGYRCSGVAIRAVDQNGRLELGAHWLEQRAVALSGWMLASIGFLYAVIIQGLARSSNTIMKMKTDDFAEFGYAMGYVLACGGIPLLGVLLLRRLRWTQLVRPTAVLVVTFLLGLPLTIIFSFAVTKMAEMGHFALMLFSLGFADPLFWSGLGVAMFIMTRTRQYYNEYRRLLAICQPPVSRLRRVGQRLAWTLTTAFALGLLGLNGLVAWESAAAVGAPSEAQVEKDKRARELFQIGVDHLQTHPEIAEPNFRQALFLFEELHKSLPSEASVSHMLARTHYNLASIALRRKQITKAERHVSDAVNSMEALVRDRPHDSDSREYPQDITEIRTQLEVLRQELTDEDSAKKVADAEGLVDEMMTKFAADPYNFWKLEPLFKKAVTVLEPLIEKTRRDGKLRLGLFTSYLMLANIRMTEDKPADAEALLVRAEPLMEQLQGAAANYPGLPHMLAIYQATRGSVWLALDEIEKAEIALDQAVATLRKLLATTEKPPMHWRASLPTWLKWQAAVHRRRARWVEAATCLREAFAILDKFVTAQPNHIPAPLVRQFREELRQDLLAAWTEHAASELNKGAELQAKRQQEAAVVPLERARDLYVQLTKEDAKEPVYRQNLGRCHYRLGQVLEELKQLDKAETEFRESVNVRARLVKEVPALREYRQELASSHWALASLSFDQNKWTVAAAGYREAVYLHAALAKERSQDTDSRWSVAAGNENVGLCSENRKRYVEALSFFRQADEEWKKLVTDFPKRPDYLAERARSLKHQVRVLSLLNRRAESEGVLRQVVAMRRKLVVDVPGNSTYRTDLAQTHWDLAELLGTFSRWGDALEEYRLAASLREQLAREAGRDAGRRWTLATTRNSLGLALQRTDLKAEAVQEFHKAAKVWAELADDYPDKPAYKFEQARTLNNLSLFLRQTKRPVDAGKVLLQVAGLRTQAVRMAPKVVEYAVALGDSQAGLSLVELDQNASTAKVLEWSDRAIKTLEPHLKDPQFGSWARRAAVDAYRNRASALAIDGKFIDAITAHDHILKICPQTEQPWYRGWRARYRVLAGDRAKAVDEAVADDKTADEYDVFLMVRVLALAARAESDSDKAKTYADRALVPQRKNGLSRNSEIPYLARSLDYKEIDQWQGRPRRSLLVNGNRSCWRNSVSHARSARASRNGRRSSCWASPAC